VLKALVVKGEGERRLTRDAVRGHEQEDGCSHMIPASWRSAPCPFSFQTVIQSAFREKHLLFLAEEQRWYWPLVAPRAILSAALSVVEVLLLLIYWQSVAHQRTCLVAVGYVVVNKEVAEAVMLDFL
jgi:hypothetical protein